MQMRWLKRFVKITLLAMIIFASVILFRSNPDPWSANDIKRIISGLNEAAARGVPHDFLMKKSVRNENLALLEKIESGAVLSKAESITYRQVFQKTLQDSQEFLSRFDAELTIITDHEMGALNNIDSSGISGHHDHHDLSARRNFAGLINALNNLDAASFSFSRIRYANAAQKDLVDLISHMGVAPNTISVPYVEPDKPWTNPILGIPFETMMKSFKQAQFALVNSPEYWLAVDEALDQYAILILAVQQHIADHTTSLERRIAGRFLAVQTLAPPVNLDRPLRRK